MSDSDRIAAALERIAAALEARPFYSYWPQNIWNPPVSGWNCPTCGAWVLNGCVHSCQTGTAGPR